MVKIVTDTAAGITPEIGQRYDIAIAPLRVNFGTETLRDVIDISNEMFLQKLASSKIFPTTSQPPAGDFLEIYTRLRAAGHDVLSVVLSNKLSGTWLSANMARMQLGDEHIAVFDTLNVAAGQALQVIEAARLAQAGQHIAEIIKRLETMRDHTHLYFVLNTLEYLAKGGRVGNAQAFIGTLLQMKPILEIRNGLVEGAERVRTLSKAHARLRAIVDEALRGKSKAQMGVMHTAIPELADEVANELRVRYRLDDCPVYPISAAVAAHAGPGALGIAFFAEP